MGFAQDSAITVNADLTKYRFEQQITNLLRGSETFTELHKGAVNTLIAEHLRPKGFNTAAKLAAISNTDDFKPALVCWVLAQIFSGQGGRNPAEREAGLSKAGFYMSEYHRSLERVVIDPGDNTTVQKRGLPIGVQVDAGSRFPALGSSSFPATIAGGEITGYDDLMIEGR